ncbi:hypothetical protein [Streptomyces sp. NPDC051569]|uniref:hypothetical protein n=1 Tax=Streptomyces sp. NPDC051569 TaxID=3365661 RepID=UPI003794F858
MAHVIKPRSGGRGGRFRRLYGESPLQLLLLLASFALAVYAGIRLLAGDWLGILVWFVGAAVLHDLVLVPLYGLGDRGLRYVLRSPARSRSRSRSSRSRSRSRSRSQSGRPAPTAPRGAVNHLRVPLFLSLLLLLVYWPLVLRLPGPYEEATGLSVEVFLGRWLLITAAFFLLSAAVLVIRRRTRGRRAPRARPRAGT